WLARAKVCILSIEERKQPLLQVGGNLGCSGAKLRLAARLSWLGDINIDLEIAREEALDKPPYLGRGDLYTVDRCEADRTQKIGDLFRFRAVEWAICRACGAVDEEGRVGEVRGDGLGERDTQPLHLTLVQISDSDCHRFALSS